MKRIFGSLLFLIFLSVSPAFGVEEKTIIKAGISNTNFSTYEHSSATFILKGNSSIIDMADNQRKSLEEDCGVYVKINDGIFYLYINGDEEPVEMKGPVTIASSDVISVKEITRKGSMASYSGIIELKSTKPDKFNIINVLDMQTYLKGVVPNEMPISFGIEALKAQAVAARNYANRPMNNHTNYDICDSVACQVYFGANSQTSISDRAVDETKGIYALYDNDIVLALYSSASGGITEDYLKTFGNFVEDKPYLKSVSDTEKLNGIKEEDYFKNSHPSFDMNSPRHRWKKTFTREELEQTLSKTLVEQSKTGAVEPKLQDTEKFYGLEDITVLKRGSSKKALEVEIKALSGNYTVKKELPIRRVFKQNGSPLYSANFVVEKEFNKKDEEKENEEKSQDTIFSTSEKSEPALKLKEKFGKKLPSSFTFYGAGFGHGVGMSQYGAGYLSSYGIPYNLILRHYYSNVTLGTIPKKVEYNNFGLTYSQEFYFSKNNKTKKSLSVSKSPLKKELEEILNGKEKSKCTLVIENHDKVSNIEFFINGYYFSPNISEFKKKILKTDITKYLVEGNNKVVFNPLKLSDKKKSVKFYIILGEENE